MSTEKPKLEPMTKEQAKTLSDALCAWWRTPHGAPLGTGKTVDHKVTDLSYEYLVECWDAEGLA